MNCLMSYQAFWLNNLKNIKFTSAKFSDFSIYVEVIIFTKHNSVF